MSFLYTIAIIGVTGLLLGIILSFAAKFFAVKTDEKVAEIRECLPGANCGACGFSGCDGYAEALANGDTAPNLCTAGGEATALGLSRVLGVEIKGERLVAYIACNRADSAEHKFGFSGANSCIAANMLYGGPLGCKYGCLGLGDCLKVCDSGAIENINGKITVCPDKCIGCGKCISACPKGILGLKPYSAKALVACSSKDKGAVARKVCENACIGCRLCEKSCEQNAIEVNGNVASIDYSKCIDCGKCAAACPQKCILPRAK